MESLNKIAEVIELLSADQKIGDGDYLTVMNSLRDMYNIIPKSVSPPPVHPALPIDQTRNVIVDYKLIAQRSGGFKTTYVANSSNYDLARIIDILDLNDRNIFNPPDDVVMDEWLHVFDTYVQNINLTYGTKDHKRETRSPETIIEWMLLGHLRGIRFRNVVCHNPYTRVFKDYVWDMFLQLNSVKQFVIKHHLIEKMDNGTHFHFPSGITPKRINDKQRRLQLKVNIPVLNDISNTLVYSLESECFTNRVRLGGRSGYGIWGWAFNALRRDNDVISETALRQFLLSKAHNINNIGHLVLIVSGLDAETKHKNRQYKVVSHPTKLSYDGQSLLKIKLKFMDKF
jgi:hypothetical protein